MACLSSDPLAQPLPGSTKPGTRPGERRGHGGRAKRKGSAAGAQRPVGWADPRPPTSTGLGATCVTCRIVPAIARVTLAACPSRLPLSPTRTAGRGQSSSDPLRSRRLPPLGPRCARGSTPAGADSAGADVRPSPTGGGPGLGQCLGGGRPDLARRLRSLGRALDGSASSGTNHGVLGLLRHRLLEAADPHLEAAELVA